MKLLLLVLFCALLSSVALGEFAGSDFSEQVSVQATDDLSCSLCSAIVSKLESAVQKKKVFQRGCDKVTNKFKSTVSTRSFFVCQQNKTKFGIFSAR